MATGPFITLITIVHSLTRGGKNIAGPGFHTVSVLMGH